MGAPTPKWDCIGFDPQPHGLPFRPTVPGDHRRHLAGVGRSGAGGGVKAHRGGAAEVGSGAVQEGVPGRACMHVGRSGVENSTVMWAFVILALSWCFFLDFVMYLL